MHRRVYLAGAAGAGLAGLAGCTALGDLGSAVLGDGPEYDVGMGRNAFEPEEFAVDAGDTVVWMNTSESRHTVTAYEGGLPDGADFFASGDFESQADAEEAWNEDFGGLLEPRDTYEHTFEVPGRYPYYCIPHELDGRGNAWMVGTIDVTE